MYNIYIYTRNLSSSLIWVNNNNPKLSKPQKPEKHLKCLQEFKANISTNRAESRLQLKIICKKDEKHKAQYRRKYVKSHSPRPTKPPP